MILEFVSLLDRLSVLQISVLCIIADLTFKSLLVSNDILAMYRLFKSLVSAAVYIWMHLQFAVFLHM